MTFNEYVAKEVESEPLASTLHSLSNNNPNNPMNKTSKSKRTLITILLWLIPIAIGVTIVIVIYPFFGQQPMTFFFVIPFIMFGFIFNLGYRNSLANKLVQHLAPNITKCLFSSNAIYHKKGGFSREFLTNLGLFPVRTLTVTNYVSGRYKDHDISFCNVLSTHRSGSGSDSHTVIDFKGKVIVFPFYKNVTTPIRIKQGSNLFKGDTVEFESELFNKYYNVYCADPEHAFYILTPPVLEALISIKENFRSCHFLFRDNQLVIACLDSDTLNDIKYTKTNLENAQEVAEFFLEVPYLFDELNLDKEYLSKTDN